MSSGTQGLLDLFAAVGTQLKKAVLEGVPEPVEGRGFKPIFFVTQLASLLVRSPLAAFS